MNKRAGLALAISLAFCLGAARAETQPPAVSKDVSIADLALCEMTIKKMTGPFSVICKELLKSPSFRQTCAKVSEANRVKCDGNEPTGPFDVRAKDLRDCGENLWQGAKDGALEIADLIVQAAKLAGSAIKSVVWYFTPGPANAAEPTTGKSAKTRSSSADALREAAQELKAMDDVTAYGAHTQTDESEITALLNAMMTKEFWIRFKREIGDWLGETLPQYWCLSPEAHNAYQCYVAGSLLGGGGTVKLAFGAGKVAVKGVKAGKRIMTEAKAQKLLEGFERTRANPPGGAR